MDISVSIFSLEGVQTKHCNRMRLLSAVWSHWWERWLPQQFIRGLTGYQGDYCLISITVVTRRFQIWKWLLLNSLWPWQKSFFPLSDERHDGWADAKRQWQRAQELDEFNLRRSPVRAISQAVSRSVKYDRRLNWLIAAQCLWEPTLVTIQQTCNKWTFILTLKTSKYIMQIPWQLEAKGKIVESSGIRVHFPTLTSTGGRESRQGLWVGTGCNAPLVCAVIQTRQRSDEEEELEKVFRKLPTESQRFDRAMQFIYLSEWDWQVTCTGNKTLPVGNDGHWGLNLSRRI